MDEQLKEAGQNGMHEDRNPAAAESDIPGLFRRFDPYRIKGNYEFYCQEFSYSAIYGNLKQENLPRIIGLLHLDKAPRILFLIQVDDCSDISKTFPEFRVFPIKGNIVTQLQKGLEERGMQGVVYSFSGRDTIGMYLCAEGEDIADPQSRAQMAELAQFLINRVKDSAKESISIGISNFCNTIGRFPQAYIECQEALGSNFYKGKNTYAFYGEEEQHTVPQGDVAKADLNLFNSRVISNLNSMNVEGYRQAVREMIQELSASNIAPFSFRLHMVEFINQVGNYYLESGMDKKPVEYLVLQSMKEVLNSNFLVNVEQTLQVFCGELYNLLSVTHQSSETKIRSLMDECFKKFYNHSDFILAKASSLCNYSSYHFSRLFKRIYGVSFNQYLANYRIDKAKALLTQSQLTVEDIAWRVGFSSTGYFCTVFKNVTGVSPRQYKNANSKQE